MKKKISNILFIACLSILFSFIFTGCSCTSHIFGTELVSDSTHHWYVCEECGEKKDVKEHNWGDPIVIEEPTKDSNGLQIYIVKSAKLQKQKTFYIQL